MKSPRMKILVMSLLRIGDIVLSAPVIRGLRERHPGAEIHLLINSQFRQVSALMPYVDRVFLFERDLLQKGLGEASIPLFEPYERLNELIDDLNGQSYDLALNITHSRLSGWLMSLVEAKDRMGLCFDATGRATFGSSWFRYLNNQVESEGSEVFHFADVFRFGSGLADEVSERESLVETPKGRAEAEAFLSSFEGNGPILAVQPLTSDAKKDWGLSRFQEALVQFSRIHPGARIAVLGAPFERERLEPLLEGLAREGVRARAAILGFEGAFSLLKSARLLLTGDTSIKHLACAAGTRVVEISIGSSDYHRTGAYLHGSVILQAREICAPCIHSKPCHRESHFCAAKLPAALVAMVTSEAFAHRQFQLRTIAEEYKAETEILRVEAKAVGFWAAVPVLEDFTESNVGRWIDLAGRKIWLQAAQGAERIEMGTEIRRLHSLLKRAHPQTSNIEWKHLLADLERQASGVEGRVISFKTGIKVLHGSYEDPKRLREFIRGMISFRERIRHASALRSFMPSLEMVIEDDISPPFTRFRRIVDAVSEIDRRIAINLKLVRGLIAEFEHGKEVERP